MDTSDAFFAHPSQNKTGFIHYKNLYIVKRNGCSYECEKSAKKFDNGLKAIKVYNAMDAVNTVFQRRS